MTFEEAYKKTGRVLCITLSATTKKAPPVLINYITAPNVVIGSAVLASAAVPGFIDAMRLQVKDENGVVRYMAKQDEVSLLVRQYTAKYDVSRAIILTRISTCHTALSNRRDIVTEV